MALTRVQATTAVSTFGGSVVLTFATPPAVGQGILVLVAMWRGSSEILGTCTDSQGNAYALAVSRLTGSYTAGIFYCARVTTSGSPFTVTVKAVPPATDGFVAVAIEIGGVGAGLVLDQVIGATGASATPATGATGALAASESLQAACFACSNTLTSMVVGAATPSWTQEFEHLSGDTTAGEGDTRIVPSAVGTTPSCSWTLNTSVAGWAAVLATFYATSAGGGGGGGERVSLFVGGLV